jgi:hypothetical protein
VQLVEKEIIRCTPSACYEEVCAERVEVARVEVPFAVDKAGHVLVLACFDRTPIQVDAPAVSVPHVVRVDAGSDLACPTCGCLGVGVGYGLQPRIGYNHAPHAHAKRKR